MYFIDSHCHLYADVFNDDLSSIIKDALDVGVGKILLPNIDVASIGPMKRIVEQYPSFLFPMMGLHPTSVTEKWKSDLEIIREELFSGNYIGVGEIGIDLHWDKTMKSEQKEVFEQQLEWSRELSLPVAIHSRDATYDVIDSIKKVGVNGLRGVFHSFGGSSQELDDVLAFSNFYIGINGVVTFKNSGLSDVLSNAPLDRIILETDAPYLAPVPYRGKRNSPVYLKEIAYKLAEIFSMDIKEIASITSKNAENLFNL